MKEFTTKGGQIFDIFASLNEAKAYIMDNYINNKEFIDDDFALFIEYKGGSYYYLCGSEECGTFKKTGIKTIIESNPATFTLWGEYRIYNIDDTDEEYSAEIDDESICWNVEER